MPLHKRSKGNSRPHENLNLRKKYASQHYLCELGYCLPHEFANARSEDTHHIFSVRSRPDLVSNLICLSKSAHGFCHKFPTDGRICCLWSKNEKSQLDPGEILTASGMTLAGWLASHIPEHEWVIPLHKSLMKAFP